MKHYHSSTGKPKQTHAGHDHAAGEPAQHRHGEPQPKDHDGHSEHCEHHEMRDHAHREHTGHGERHGHPHHPAAAPSPNAKYFCPMHPEVESDKPGDCPKCGMALERNPGWVGSGKTMYTCPMHPEVQQDHPGDCPKCGMPLEPMNAAAADAEDEAELQQLARKLWVGAILAAPVFLSAMAGMFPGVGMDAASGGWRRWMELILATPVV